MDSPTFITIITALAALIGAASPIIVALIQAEANKEKEDPNPKKGILLPSNVVLHHPQKLQVSWLVIFSFAFLGGMVGYGGAKLVSVNASYETPTITATIPFTSETPEATFTHLAPTETLIPSLPTKWYVRVYNIDDIGTVYVNDREITSVRYSEDTDWIDVTLYFSPDSQNRVRFTLQNKETGYRWGFAIMRNNLVIWRDEEGEVNRGARNNDQSSTNQVVYDKILLVSQDGQITIQP